MRNAVVFALGFTFAVTQPIAAETSIRPKPRPMAAAAEQAAPQVQLAAEQSTGGVAPRRSIRPEARPEGRDAGAAPKKKGLLGKLFGPKTVAKSAPKRSVSGSVCNDPGVRGTAIPTIRGAHKGCGIENPVRVTEVDGVTLSTPATLDCETAVALREWVSDALKPSFGRTEVTGLRVAAHYACRTRNNRPGARISEHGRGKAIDIAGIKLASGTELTVLDHYKSSKGKPIRTAHKKACGIFGTTLGPGSDGYHADHLHLDTARYRSGPYCK